MPHINTKTLVKLGLVVAGAAVTAVAAWVSANPTVVGPSTAVVVTFVLRELVTLIDAQEKAQQ